VEFKATLDDEIQKCYTSYNVKAYDLFLKALSKNKGESEGFAPGEEGFLILAGTNLEDGSDLDIESMTSYDTGRFRLNITDGTGKGVTSSWSLMNITTFYDYMAVPTDIRDEIKQSFGETLPVISFTTPSENGIYDLLVQVNLSEWNSVRDSIVVQDIFVHGEPVNKMGWFSPTVAPNSTARIMIIAFDPSTGEEIPSSDIHEAGLIEVWSESAGDVVTEYMENPVLDSIEVPFMGSQKVLKFNVTDSYLGFHYVRFWINATVDGEPKHVIGNAWFDEKLYTIRAKPVFDSGTGMFKAFSSGDDIQLKVHVQDVSGNNVSTASIKAESVMYRMNGETIPITESTTSCTTNSNGDATLTISPEDDLKSGSYGVRIKMTTQDGVTDYGNGWFEVRNFIFSPYSTSWNVGLNQPINFTLNAFDGSFDEKEVNVTLTKIISMGDWNKMTPPTVYNDTAISVETINGTGYYEFPGLANGGNYEFVFEATDGNSTEIGRAWVHATAFVVWVDSDWRYEFPTNGFMNFTVKAADDSMSGNSAHNLSNVTVEKVMQGGMWMTSYKTKSQMASITSTEPGDAANEIDVSINTSGWGQGAYFMELKAMDDEGNDVYTNFWFRLELASVTVTNPMRVTINPAQYYTNATSVNATNDIASKQNSLASTGNISAGKISGPVIGGEEISPVVTNYEVMGEDSWNHSMIPYFTMVAIDSVRNTVYIEYEVTEQPPVGNLSDDSTTQVFNASEGDSFTDYTGRTWTITDIGTDGTVKLEGANTLKNGLLLNESIMAMSKSGKFLVGSFHDEEWRLTDLDGDGEYYEDMYIILMIDSITAGKYDKVLISNSYNFSAGYIDASAGGPIGSGGDPIYLLSNKYQSGAYNLEFSTYNQGWKGMRLGTFPNGSVIKIPFLVQTPTGEPLAGKDVRIDYLIDESKRIQELEGVNATTDASGLALIEINSSEANIPTGSWMIHYNVTIGDEHAVADEEMFWELVCFELRNFVVSGSLGTPGEIELVKVSDDNTNDGIPGNNMLLAYGDEIEFKRGISAHYCEIEDMQRLSWPFEDWYYNSNSGAFYYSSDGGFTLTESSGDVVNSSRARLPLNYTIVSTHNPGNTISLNLSESTSFYEDLWNFTMTDSDGTNAGLDMSYAGWTWTVPGYAMYSEPISQSFVIGDRYWIGGLEFEVTAVDVSSMELTLINTMFVASLEPAASLMDNDTANGELEAYRGSVTSVTFGGQEYQIFGYEDQAGTMQDLLPYSGMVETYDKIMVVNTNDAGDANIYRIGETISAFDDYYVASASRWGGKFILLDSSVTEVYPLPEYTADEPVFYVGRFSDEDVGIDVATAIHGGVDEEEYPGLGNISSDDRYHILLVDTLANGVSFPTMAIYDDDPDLTRLRSSNWMDYTSVYDMYTSEMGYMDSLPMGDTEGVIVNMSEGEAWEIGTGNMDSWPLAFPTLNIDEDAGTAVLKSFVPAFDFDVNENITIYVTAREFDGTTVNGTAELRSLKMTFGGTYIGGFAENLPISWNMSSAMINTTLVNGEGTLIITPDDISHIDYDFGEFTAFVDIEKESGGTETLKMNFFRMDEENEPDFDDGSKGGVGDMEDEF
jgi:hypothetical protein